MDTKKKVEVAIAYCGISKAELARRMGTSPQALGKKLQTGKLKPEEWEALAGAMGAIYEHWITFPDGRRF